MINSKLILLLKSFKKKEVNAFELFISSPLYNKNVDVINLLSILKKHYPKFDDKTLIHTRMSHQLFGKTDVVKFRYTMTDLTKLIERFIAYQALLYFRFPFLRCAA